METLKVWYNGNSEIVKIGQEVTVFRSGSGLSVFGEKGKIARTTKNNIVIETESGAIVKTEIDTLNTIGKARKNDYVVSLQSIDKFNHIIASKVTYWNEKKLILENK